jgi:hypothetical protein
LPHPISPHHWEATHLFDHHVIGRVAQGTVIVNDNRCATNDLTDASQSSILGVE